MLFSIFSKVKKLEFYGPFLQTMLFLATMIRLEHRLLAYERAIASIKWIRLLWFCHSITTNLISSASFHFILKSKRLYLGWGWGCLTMWKKRFTILCCRKCRLGGKCENGIRSYFTNCSRCERYNFVMLVLLQLVWSFI